MAELDLIAEALRRQKNDLTKMREKTKSRTGETADLVDKIEDLRRRAEETQRRFQASASESSKRRKKQK